MHDDSEDDSYRRAVGKRIRVQRVIQDMSQDDLARTAGVTRSFVSAIERGAQGLDAVRLRRLAAAMDMTLAELLADPEPTVRTPPSHSSEDGLSGKVGLRGRT